MGGLIMRRDSLGFLVTDIARLMRRRFQQRIEGRSGLTLAQARALIHVSRTQGMRQVDLAEQLEIQPITLARLIDQLVEAGVVERRADPQDRRAYQLYLTAAASAQLALIEQVSAEVRAQALQGLDALQAEQLLTALQQVRGNLCSGS